MLRNYFIIVAISGLSYSAQAQSTSYAQRVTCEMQTADTDSLRDLVWLQGTTPLVQAIPFSSGRPLAYDEETTVRMLISQSATNALWAVRTNSATITNGYAIQWPTVGTNS